MSAKINPTQKRPSGVSSRIRDFQVGQIYHVYQRGNHGKRTFHDQHARLAYLSRFFVLAREQQVLVHNFCLMHNHVHFVLEQQTIDGISNLMQKLQPYHARFHNQRMQKTGNLWQQHFGCKQVESDEYYLTLMRYVEVNPVVARRASRAEEYRWSGALAHVLGEQVTITVDGQSVQTDLYLDGWRKRCHQIIEAGWLKLLQGRYEDPSSIEKIESMLDGKKRQRLAQQNRADRRREQQNEKTDVPSSLESKKTPQRVRGRQRDINSKGAPAGDLAESKVAKAKISSQERLNGKRVMPNSEKPQSTVKTKSAG